MSKNILGGPSNVRIEEHSAGEESISNTSSADITETEEHVTVHSKREPLPWSLRGPSYNKPLPGIQDSPIPGTPPAPLASPGRAPRISPRPGSPFDTEARAGFTSPRQEAGVLEASSPASGHNASFEEESPPISGRPLSGFDEEAAMETVPFVTVPMPTSALALGAPMIQVNSPMSSAHERSPYVSPVRASQKISSPQIEPVLSREGVSPLNLSTEQIEPISGSPAPSLTPKESPQASPAPSLSALEEGLSPNAIKPVISLGDKRSRSPLSQESPRESEVKHVSKLPKISSMSQTDLLRLRMHYCKDWKVNRKYRSERFFFPRLFNPDRLQYAHIIRKQRCIPKEFKKVAEDVDLGARYRRDWRVQRQHQVYFYFNSNLFDGERLKRIKIPMTRHQKKRHFKQRMAALGITDYTSPAAKLRLDWTVSRRHSPEYYFEAQLFDSIIPASEKLRQDWYTLRRQNPALNQNGSLFDARYVKRRLDKDIPMIHRITAHLPPRYPKRIKKHYTDPGQKYREDWKVDRQNDVYLYFEPTLFDEEKAMGEAAYWNDFIAGYRQRHSGDAVEKEGREFKDSKDTGKTTDSSATHHKRGLGLSTDTPEHLYSDDFLAPYQSSRLDPFSNMLGLIAGLKSEGNVDEDGKIYDWPFWEDLYRSRNMDDDTRAEILRHIRDPKYAGIPVQLRPTLWLLMSGAATAANLHGEYEMLRGMPSKYDDSITSDVWAAIRSHDLSPEQALSLSMLLGAYCNYDPECGYSPALALIGATLIKNTSEEDSFALLVQVMQIQDHRRYLQPSLGGTSLLEFQFENLLLDLDPQLQMHLSHFDIDSTMYIKEFYANLGAGLGPQMHTQVLDLFFLEGYIAIHQIALLTVVENRDELLKVDWFVGIMEILSGNLVKAHEEWTVREWIVLACSIFISDEELSELCQSYIMRGQILHEQQVLHDLSFIEGENDQILYSLWWVCQQMKQVCLSREIMASQLFEADHNLKVVVNEKYDAIHTIHELKHELASSQHDHNQEIKRLTALLNSDQHVKESKTTVHTYSIPVIQRGDEKIFKI